MNFRARIDKSVTSGCKMQLQTTMSTYRIPKSQQPFPKLKICGITTLEDARFAAGALADYLGFVFASGSPRQISPRDAAEICGWIHGPEKVGVFVNQTPDEINAIVSRAGLDFVQLHGEESTADARKIGAPVIKAFRIREEADLPVIREQMKEWEDVAKFYLYDSRSDKMHGGTGETWNWELLTHLAPEKPFFLAGGLNRKNAADAIRITSPFAVDLSSSLESEPGRKDFDKMQSFFETWNDLREAD
jgi:phosphoribosylanthranilate isomerase